MTVGILPGGDLVPIYEEHAARLERGIGITAWSDMDVDEKAFIIAMRRVSLSMKNLQTEAEIKHAENKAKQARK